MMFDENISSPTSAALLNLSGGGELGEMIRTRDWSNSPLGPIDSWPQSLLTALSICLNSKFAIVIWWGHELTVLYNDAYAETNLGIKHPAALGKAGKDCWHEIWPTIGPMLQGVMETGRPTWSDDLLLEVERSGYPEEYYFTFSYSPIRGETGDIAGVFTPVAVTTEKVIGTRRLATLHALASQNTQEQDLPEVCCKAMAILSKNRTDIPFAMLYLLNHEKKQAQLVAASGIEQGHAACPMQIDFSNSSEGIWPIFEVSNNNLPITNELESKFDLLPCGAWPVPPESALTIPILLPGNPLAIAVLIAAVSPRKRLDDEYFKFYQLVAGQLGTTLASVLAYEQERKKAEELAALDRAKTEFFSNVSHEFRTPLTLILGQLDNILNDVEQPPLVAQQKHLQVLQSNAIRLLKLVNALLDFSRIEAGRMKATYELIDVAKFTTDLSSVFRSAIEKAGIEFNVDIQSIEGAVYLDRDMWEKIVFNLLSNALKYTQQGTIKVLLKQKENNIKLQVIDTGIGIPANELPHVFERFHRIEGVDGRSHEGTGIGLALTQELIKLHGGKIKVASQFASGSIFTVTIPIGKAHLAENRIITRETDRPTGLVGIAFVEEASRWLKPTESYMNEASASAAQQGNESPISVSDNKRYKILLADDNADMREYVSELLQAAWDVKAVSNGIQALQVVKAELPDLVLSDVMMPQLDGFGLIRALRSDPRTEHIPIILLSARAGEESRVEGLEQGADDYLVKPFSAKELMARVRTHLELGRLRAQLESERIKIQAAFIQSEENYKLLASVSPAGILHTDLTGQISYANERGCQIFGLTAEEMKGFTWQNAVYSEDKQRIAEGWERFIKEQNEKIFKAEYRCLRSDGTIAWLVTEVAAEKDDDNYIKSCVAIVTDITEVKKLELERLLALQQAEEQQRRRAEEAESYQENQQRFMDIICHEIRNPINGIFGSADVIEEKIKELLKEMAETTDIYSAFKNNLAEHLNLFSESVKAIKECAKHQKSIADSVLDMSKIEAGEAQLEYIPYNPKDIILSVVNMFKLKCLRQGIKLFYQLPTEDTFVKIDPQRLKRVLINFVSNALSFTEKGKIKIALEFLGKMDEGACYLQITIKDTGIGMNLEQIERLFQRFSTGGMVTFRRYSGSGLGLFINKNLIQLMKGNITVKSAEGEGTAFTFTIPCEIAQKPPGKSIKLLNSPRIMIKDFSSGIIERSKRILIVEDNIINQKVLAAYLDKKGYEYQIANNGREALDSFDPNAFDLIFMDIVMPKLDGVEATKQIRRREKELSIPLIPIIGLSGNAQGKDKVVALAAGMTDYLTKPYKKNEIYEKINFYRNLDQQRENAIEEGEEAEVVQLSARTGATKFIP